MAGHIYKNSGPYPITQSVGFLAGIFVKKAVVDQIVLRLLGQDTDIFLSLWHSALNGLITVWYLSFTLILLAPQGLQICNFGPRPLPHRKQGFTLLCFIKKLCIAQ